MKRRTQLGRSYTTAISCSEEYSVISAVLSKLEHSASLSDGDKAMISGLLGKSMAYHAGRDIVSEGSQPTTSCVLLEGVACRYRAVPTGKRQIMSFHVAGDWIDLNSFFLEPMDHSLGAITECHVAHIPHATIAALIESNPKITRLLWRETMMDSAIYREWVVNVGARSARERMAHLFCELHAKMAAVGLADGVTFALPLTQQDLADALGVSTVHANRTLQELRAENLIVFQRRTMTFPDIERLRELGQFDPTYLHLSQQPKEASQSARAAPEAVAS